MDGLAWGMLLSPALSAKTPLNMQALAPAPSPHIHVQAFWMFDGLARDVLLALARRPLLDDPTGALLACLDPPQSSGAEGGAVSRSSSSLLQANHYLPAGA